jgi:peptidyl-tRNA hydrolase, PTH1 family
MKLIVCLGNPGSDYTVTRHNAGFLFADYLIKTYSFTKEGKKFKSILYSGMIDNEKIFLIKPQTFMNLSGEAVQLIVGFYKLEISDVRVVFDDFELALGTTRFRWKGSGGTHNGMKSIIQLLGHTDIPRLRFGIGPLPENMPVTPFVLGKFEDEELKILIDNFPKAEEALHLSRQ